MTVKKSKLTYETCPDSFSFRAIHIFFVGNPLSSQYNFMIKDLNIVILKNTASICGYLVAILELATVRKIFGGLSVSATAIIAEAAWLQTAITSSLRRLELFFFSSSHSLHESTLYLLKLLRSFICLSL